MATNSMGTLYESLQEKMKADERALQEQTLKLLAHHEKCLRSMSESALATTKIVMQRQSLEIKRLHERTVSQLNSILKWPIVCTLGLCCAMVIGTSAWSWWHVEQALAKEAQVQSLLQLKQKQMCQAEIYFRASPAGRSVFRKG